MPRLDYLHRSPQNNDNNNAYLDYCFISSNPVSYVYSDSHPLDSPLHDSVQLLAAPLTATGPYPSPPLTGSALRHTIPLQHVPEDKESSSHEESLGLADMNYEQPTTLLPLSPPPTVPISTLVLPFHSDLDSPCPGSPSEDLHSPRAEHVCLSDDLQESDVSDHSHPTPLPPQDWLTVESSPMTVPMDQDDTTWDEHRDTLCSEPTRSVWSPESPLQNDELELDSEPSSPSSASWRSELSSEDLPVWEDNWSNPLSLDWAHSRGRDDEDDYYVDPGSFSCIPHPHTSTSYRHANISDDKEFHTFLDFPMADLDCEPSSFELLQSPVQRSIPLQISDTDDNYSEVDELPPPSPPRRTLLPDLGGSEPDSQACIQPPLNSPRLLSLPGAETDDELLTPVHYVLDSPMADIDLFPPMIASSEGLGISLIAPSMSMSSPAFTNPSLPEFTNVENLVVDFPELAAYPYPIPTEIPSSVCHPDYNIAKLVQLCRKTKQAERNAKKQEVEQSLLVATILKGLLPPFDGDHIAKRNKLRELQSAAENRAEARKVRKRERERCREVRSLLTLKINDIVKRKGSFGPVSDEREGSVTVAIERPEAGAVDSPGKKWMMNDMDKVVAKMLLNRKDRFRRPLGSSRKNGRSEYLGSPLSTAVHVSTENGEDADVSAISEEMGGIMSTALNDVEMPPIMD